MKTSRTSIVASVLRASAILTLVSHPAFAQDTPAKGAATGQMEGKLPADQPKATTSASSSATSATAPSVPGSPATAKPSEAEMMKMMMEMSKLNENHKLLGQLAGTWTTRVKMWMAPGAPPMESAGSAVRKPIMGGRYFIVDYKGKMQMPGKDGKMLDMDFTGTSMEGYDNVKKKFIGTWMDSMSTGIFVSEGDYDPATKTFTYTGEAEMIPGAKTKVRELLKIVDADHHVFEYYENRGGQDVKTMEIRYTRQK